MLLVLVEAVVERLGGIGDFLDLCRGLAEPLRHEVQAFDGVRALIAFHARPRRLPAVTTGRVAVANRRLEGRPGLLLIGSELERGFHAGELGVQHERGLFVHEGHVREAGPIRASGKSDGAAREGEGDQRSDNELAHESEPFGCRGDDARNLVPGRITCKLQRSNPAWVDGAPPRRDACGQT